MVSPSKISSRVRPFASNSPALTAFSSIMILDGVLSISTLPLLIKYASTFRVNYDLMILSSDEKSSTLLSSADDSNRA